MTWSINIAPPPAASLALLISSSIAKGEFSGLNEGSIVYA